MGLICLSHIVVAQTNIQGAVNQYTKVAKVANSVVTVEDVSFIKAHDTVLLIQMTGVSRDGQNVYNAGKYEFHIVRSVNTASKNITLVSNTSYDAVNELVQLVRVPSYKTAKVNGELTCSAWDGEKGGVLALMVEETLTLEADINVSACGFLGGGESGDFKGDCSEYTGEDYPKGASNFAGYKGQGAVMNSILSNSSNSRGRKEFWNGGGGGNGMYSGGGGGGNAGKGARGGRQVCNLSQYLALGGELNRYSEWTSRVFMGGGGGSGTGENTPGGKGGGIVIIAARELRYSGDAAIKANGQSVSGAPEAGGAGGGGAGGSILLSVENYGNFKAEVKGGNGGNTTRGDCGDITTGSIGVGGGGGGGLLYVTGSVATVEGGTQLTGGNRGKLEPQDNALCVSALNGGDGIAYGGLKLQLRGFVYNFITTADTTVCFGEIKTVKASQPQGGNGTYEYLWEQKIRSTGNWQPATGANTGRNYVTPALSDTVFYRRTVKTTDNGQPLEDQSIAVRIDVVPEIINRLDFPSDSTQCGNVTSLIIEGQAASGGGKGTFAYQWEENINNAGWNVVRGATDKDITVSLQPGEQYYRRKVTSQGCTVVSETTQIHVLPVISGNMIQGDQNLCETGTPAILSGQPLSGGNGLYGYDWQMSDNNENWTELDVTTDSYQPDQKYIGDRYYRRIVTSGQWDCCSVTSQSVMIHYDQQPSPAEAGATQFLNFKFNTVVDATPITVGKGIWTAITDGFNIVHPDQLSTEITNLKMGTNTLQWTVSNGACPENSDQVTIEVRDVIIPSGFSPNNDNINDCFKAVGAENATSSELIVFNRYNKIVYRSSSFKGSEQDCTGWWDGHNSSGNELPSGTYFYQLTLNGDKVYKGYVVLKR